MHTQTQWTAPGLGLWTLSLLARPQPSGLLPFLQTQLFPLHAPSTSSCTVGGLAPHLVPPLDGNSTKPGPFLTVHFKACGVWMLNKCMLDKD